MLTSLSCTLRAVVSPGRMLRERNHCKQPFDFPSSMRVHVTPTSNVKWHHFLFIRGKIMTFARPARVRVELTKNHELIELYNAGGLPKAAAQPQFFP